MIFGSEDNALVKELLYAQKIKLMNFKQAEAYTRLFPALSHVLLPAGVLDPAKRMPPHDIHLLSATTSLIVRKDLHPGLIYLLLDAAVEIHSNAGWVNKRGEFPSPRELDFPSSKYAERFYKSGRPFLLDYLPSWIAVWIDRIILILLPVAVVLIPLIRGYPGFTPGGTSVNSTAGMENLRISNQKQQKGLIQKGRRNIEENLTRSKRRSIEFTCQ